MENKRQIETSCTKYRTPECTTVAYIPESVLCASADSNLDPFTETDEWGSLC